MTHDPILNDRLTEGASASTEPARDLVPLAWVLDEVRKSVLAASKALERLAGDSAATAGNALAVTGDASIRAAEDQFHRVAGVLELVQQPVGARFARSLEDVAHRFAARPGGRTDAEATIVRQGGFALIEFLEDRLSERPRPSIALFPRYRQVQELAGVHRVHLSDMWSLPWRWLDPELPVAPTPETYGSALRERFDRGTLQVMQRGDPAAARDLSNGCLGLAFGVAEPHARIFWKVAAAFYEALAHGLIAVDRYVKSAASQVLLQYSELARAGSQPPEPLVHELLFFCALAKPSAPDATPTLHAVRATWNVAHEALDAYQEPTYGLYDPLVLAQARRRISAVKDAWSALSGGDAAHLDGALTQLGAVIDSMRTLLPQGEPLTAELEAVQQKIAASREPPSPELAMETAAVLLFLEASTNEFRPRDPQFAGRLKRLAERLASVRKGGRAPRFEPWMERLYRQLNDKEAIGTVVDELRVGLAQTEQYLDQYFRHPGDATPLERVPGWLSEMHGVLSVLGVDQAALAVSRIRAQVGELKNGARKPDGDALTALFQKFGNNFGTLGFLIDTLNYQPVLARKLFAYDEARGELTYVPGRTPAAAVTTVTPLVTAAELDAQPEAGTPLPSSAARHVPASENPPEEAPLESGASAVHAADLATSLAGASAGLAPAADDDRGLLAIFLGEARDVLAAGQQALDALAGEPSNHDQLTRLRRGFHTLKGSSGMLGLTEFSTAARSFENLLNAALAQEKPLEDRVRTGAASALAAMAHWVDDLDRGHDDAWRAAPFEALAQALLQGGDLPAAGLEPAGAARAPHGDAGAEPQLPIAAEGAPVAAVPMQAASALPDLPLLPNLDLPPEPASEGVFSTWSDELADAPEAIADADAGLASHAVPPEPAQPPAEAGAVAADAASAASLRIGALEISAPLYNTFLKEADDWSRQLETRLSGWASGIHAEVPESATYYAHSLAGSSATVGLNDLAALARAVETALAGVNDRTRDMARGAGALIAAATEIRAVLHQFAAGILKRPDPAVLASVQALLPRDAAAARAAGFARADLLVPAAIPFDFDDVGDEPVVPAAALAPAVKSPPAAWLANPKGALDSLDHDLFPIFEEEASELLPLLGSALQRWVEQPADAEARAQVRRVLHTLKGSARLVGALTLGDMAHDAESAIEAMATEHLEPSDIKPLVERFDLIDETFQRLRAGAAAAATPAQPAQAEPAPAAPAAVPGDAPAPQPLAGPTPLVLPATAATAQQTVRVHPELLDRLLASSSEVTTSRARLNSGVAQMRDALNELAGSVVRLRRHVRDVELQVAAEMPAHDDLLPGTKPDFDALEFDRYTRAQELTRMLAESVDDVETIERGLRRLIENGEDELATQARQSRELQHDLVRTRMVEFESVAGRLHRVVRQTAAESAKQARLEITGGAIELDRAVLDRMVPSFEHLLRNSVVHGIEAPAVRTARGKDPTGLITIAIRQTGNDVSIAFSDDGAGLALDRIRARALDAGLIQPGDRPDAAALARFIFKSGFTTAERVTELAGRGVGMDVVQADVESLGGRIEVESQEGQGAAFHLTLPVTTALTRVVLMRAGDLVFGVPSGLVETVRRATAAELEQAYAQGSYAVRGENLPFFWAGALLQRGPRGQVDAQSVSNAVVIFRSAAQRIAVHVDEMLGNQEVLVKGLGPQLSRLPGLVAATVLTTGAVALIYNPVAMVPAYDEHKRAAPGAEVAAAAGLAHDGPDAGHAGPPLILVVDDSITVRRVMQRLLRRQGYRVALAADGEQGLEQIEQERPALVLTDIEMPRMDGFELLRAIRADAALADLPVVVITSRAAEKHRDHARELGASHYLGKPYSENELLGLVRTYAAAAPAVTH